MSRGEVGRFLRSNWWQVGMIAAFVVGWVVRVEAAVNRGAVHELWAEHRNAEIATALDSLNARTARLESSDASRWRLECLRARNDDGAWDQLIAVGVPCPTLLGNRLGGL